MSKSKIVIECDNDEMNATVDLQDDDHINYILRVFSIIQNDFLINQDFDTTISYDAHEL